MPKRPVRPSARRCTRLKSEPGRPCAPNPGSAAPAEAGPSCSILHLEDDAGDADLIQATLQQQGIKCRLRQVKDRTEYVAALASPDFDLILADLSLPSFDGWTALDLAQKACPEIPFIFLSGTMSQASAAQSFQRGAADCLSKNDLAHLAPSVLRVIEVLRERSGRRRAEQERDQFFRLSADLLCVVGFDGCFQKINPALEQALGIPAAQLHGKQLLDLVHPEDGPAMSACLARLHQEAPPQLFESRLRGHDGTYLWLQWTATALRERRVVYASARDVTERKRGEEALRLSEARTRAIIDSALDCVIAMDADGRIVEFNPAAERTFGYIRGEVMGRPLAELIIPPSLREKQSEGLARLLRTGDSSLLGRRIEVVAMRRDGLSFPWSWRSPVSPATAPRILPPVCGTSRNGR